MKLGEALYVECHFECHCAGKIRKRTRTDESRRQKAKTLNRWLLASSSDTAHVYWCFVRLARRIPASQPNTPLTVSHLVAGDRAIPDYVVCEHILNVSRLRW